MSTSATMSETSRLINNLLSNIKFKFFNPILTRTLLKKIRQKEKQDTVKALTDLRDLKSKSESEVYQILNAMVKNKQFFMYCGSLLLNINPGPHSVKDYLNLQSWVKETSETDEFNWKPHLYSFMYYVYQAMISEQKNQVINMLGQIGSGKTFNIVHIIEYFCCMVGPEGHQIEVFDMIHKSIQLIHIMGSIFRENNLESTSCGMLLKLGFGSDNKICTFDLEAKILDCTLPFSENGRSFSILHAFMTAASTELKRNFNLPEDEVHLNFFRRFTKTFSNKTKSRFRLNDLEIWNRFHSLLSAFHFTKAEVIELLQIFAFILMINELGTTKIVNKTKGTFTYEFIKGPCSRKLAKNLNMSEEDLFKVLGNFKDLSEMKTLLISLMKNAYHIVFDFILSKVKEGLRQFFDSISPTKPLESLVQTKAGSKRASKANIKLSGPGTINRNEGVKYIDFIDFPGEVDDSTLGGLFTNLANECLNLYAGNSYSTVVEKLLEEKVSLKLFPPLHCYNIVRSIMGDKGLFHYLSMPFTQSNLDSLRKEAKKQPYFRNCINFIQDFLPGKDPLRFQVQFTTKTITYNYEALHMEMKSLMIHEKLLRVFSACNNKIIKGNYQRLLDPYIDFSRYSLNNLQALFSPIEGISPFVVYCLHSNNSYKLFFDQVNDNEKHDGEWVIPHDLTINLLKKSLCIPVLYWEWFGYHEWVENEAFIQQFALKNFEGIDAKLKAAAKKKEALSLPNEKAFVYSELCTEDKISYIINSIIMNCDYLQGKNYVIMKKGTMTRLGNKLKSLLKQHEIQESINKKTEISRQDSRISKGSKGMKKSNSLPKFGSNLSKKNIEKTEDNQTDSNNKINSKADINQLRRNQMKRQCHLDILDFKPSSSSSSQPQSHSNQQPSQTSKDQPSSSSPPPQSQDKSSIKYNIYRIFDKTSNKILEDPHQRTDMSSSSDPNLSDYRRNNNIIVPERNIFQMVRNTFNPLLNTNYKMFDYTKFTKQIITIQSVQRIKIAKEHHMLLKYLHKSVIKIQSTVRMLLVKIHLKKFRACLRNVIIIQRFYRKRFTILNASCTVIQKVYIGNLKRRVIARKLIRYRYCKEHGEKYIDSNEDKRQVVPTEQKNMFLIYRKDIAQKLKDKKKTTKQYYDIINEKNKNKVVSVILKDKELIKENEEQNRKFANQKGVTAKKRYEYLQIDHKRGKQKNRSVPRKRIEDELIEYGENIKHKRAQEQVDKLKTDEMQYAFQPRIQQSMSSFDRNLLYGKTTEDIANKDFLTRAKEYEETKGNRIEYLRMTYVDPLLDQCTFKPKLSDLAKNMTRTINDLYAWKERKNRTNEANQKKKMEGDDLDFLNSKRPNPVHESLKQLQEKLPKNRSMASLFTRDTDMQNDINNHVLDLWPVQLDKNYNN